MTQNLWFQILPLLILLDITLIVAFYTGNLPGSLLGPQFYQDPDLCHQGPEHCLEMKNL